METGAGSILRVVNRTAAALSLLFLLACHEGKITVHDDDTDIQQWRSDRATRLKAEDGWLTLVGLDWLKEGDNELRVPPKTGTLLGSVRLENGKTVLSPARDAVLSIDGKPVTVRVELANDAAAQGPTVLRSGSVSVQVIKRNDRYALRIKDAQSPARLAFKGMEYFPVDAKWRIEARYEPYNPPKKIPITNVLGMTGDEVSPGALVMNIDGRTYRIDPILEQGEKDLFIIFRDETRKDSTYPAGRYLYAHPPGPDGKVIVDFNKAYNPPCTFTPFATCPLPPPQNQLAMRIEAGEKRYAGGHS